MAKYSIEDTTLVALGDGVRKQVGKFKTILTPVGELLIDSITIEKWDDIPVEATCTISYAGMGGAYVRFDFLQQEMYNCRYFYNCYDIFDSSYDVEFWLDDNNSFFIDVAPSYEYYQIKVLAEDSECGINNIDVYAEIYDINLNPMTESASVKNTMTPEKMIEELNNMPSSPTAEELTFTGDCDYRFAYSGWDWFVEKYKDKIVTKDIESASHMFDHCTLAEIPFELNFDGSINRHDISYLFSDSKLTRIPKINRCRAESGAYIFYGCKDLRELDYESVKGIDWSFIDTQATMYGGSRANTFYYCCSLRSLPMEFLNHGNPLVNYSYSVYYNLFYNCYALDEVIDLPIPHSQANWTSNAFTGTFDNCCRLKNLTFALNNGAPYVCPNWKNQYIDLTKYVGYVQYYYNITNYNTGITSKKEVDDFASYEALKNDPDWFTEKVDYSRYNHDSAVATINSLPDCSAKGGNTIKFRSDSGALTDGGRIDNLTAEEIAVATAKGWTVTFV